MLFLLKESIKNSDLPIEMTNENDFAKMDNNGDGVLSMDELNKFVGC